MRFLGRDHDLPEALVRCIHAVKSDRVHPRGTPGPCSTWFVSRFPLGSMAVTRVHIQLVEVARSGGKAGVFEIHGITLVGAGSGGGRTP